MAIEIFVENYECEYCGSTYEDRLDAERHEKDCQENPDVIAAKERAGEEMGLPPTLRATREMLAGNARLTEWLTLINQGSAY